MANTVTKAFEEFQKEKVNLEENKSKKARTSRDWLVTQIHAFTNNDNDFPEFYEGKDIFFGSFARRTKKRELDDIDIMICLKGDGATYTEYTDRIEIHVPEMAKKLYKLCDNGKLNSNKVINKFISNLKSVHQYNKAEIHKDKMAATLELSSYEWNFDIVPCFMTAEDVYGKTYYLIPDGVGNWMKTDPRLDRKRVSEVNQQHEGNVLNAIRVMKFWNKRPTMPTMSSYLLENMILDYYESSTDVASNFVNVEVVELLKYINDHINDEVEDPKGIQGDLNTLDQQSRNKIQAKAASDYSKAVEAREYEDQQEHKKSINKWKEIFGDEFPAYTES